MKYRIFLFIAAVWLFSCGQPQETDTSLQMEIPTTLPEDLEQLKDLLAQGKDSQRKLEQFIADLEEKVEQLDTTEVRRISVTAIHPTKADFKHYAEIQGAVAAEDAVMASSEAGGRLIQMPWKEGDYINKGDLVGKLDMEQVNKQIAELETRLDLARTVYERQKKLWDQNIGSEIQYLQAKNNKESLEKSIETVRFQLTKANIYSPATGFVDRVMIQQGEMAAPGAPILMILNTNTVKVVAGVPERYLKDVRKGQQVKVKFPSLEDEERTARVSLIGRRVDPSNRTFEVEVSLSNPKGILKPNLQSVMLINDETIQDAIMVPEELLRQDVAGEDYVYIVEKTTDGDAVKKVLVETGDFSEGLVVIEEGLTGDELIIAKGGRGLTEGQMLKVEITDEKATETEE